MKKNSVVLVTGSTSGIGLGIAKAFAENGCRLVLNGLGDKATIDNAIAAVSGDRASKALYHPADMRKPDQIEDMIEFTVREFGSIDVLVNNAGIQHTDTIENFPVEKWQAVIDINLSAVFYGMHFALPHMYKQKFGRVINIASVHGLVASATKAAYCAAKGGVVQLTKVCALESAPKGEDIDVTCNAICPGWVRTPLVMAQIEKRAKDERISVEEAQRRLISEKQPSGRFVEIDDLARTALWICETPTMNGSSIVLDGAWTAQ